MHKNLSLSLVALALFLSSASTVGALEVIIDSAGKMTFYNDGVLGDTTDTEFLEKRQTLELKTEAMLERHKEELRQNAGKNVEELKRKHAAERLNLQKESDSLRSKEVEASATRNRERPLKEVDIDTKQELRIKQQKAGVTVEVRQKNSNELEATEEASPERLRIEMPAELRIADEGTESGKPAWVTQLQEERRQRIGEKLELKRTELDGEESLEVTSRDITAKVQQSAEMIIDPETNHMSVVKPNGEVAVIVHLPDQAIARLDKFGAMDGVSKDHGRQLELVTTEEGEVVYKLTVPKQKKFLGFIPREVETEIELNDETGEVTEETVSEGVFDSFLNALTF